MRVLHWIWGWIRDNRKWVFDGFGVAVIIAISGVVWNWYYSPDGERNQADEPKVYLQEQSPDEVAARINSLNSLEREPVANQAYIGRWVRWSGTILDIRSPSSFLKGGAFTVTVVAHTSGPAYAQLKFLSTERHLVKSLQEGDLISYEAKIIRVFNAHVFLTHVTFTQPERSVVGRRQGFESKTHGSLLTFTKLQISKRPKRTDLSEDLQGVTLVREQGV
jgi:hypothetical protein